MRRWLTRNVPFTLLRTVLSVLILLSFLDGVCNVCVCVSSLSRVAVRAFSLACAAYISFYYTLHILSFLANKRERELLLTSRMVTSYKGSVFSGPTDAGDYRTVAESTKTVDGRQIVTKRWTRLPESYCHLAFFCVYSSYHKLVSK